MHRAIVQRKKIFEQLVQDSELFGLTETESLEYVKTRSGGLNISRSTFYAIKKRKAEREDELVEDRMNRLSRVGFYSDYLKRVDELEASQKILFRVLIDESQKPKEERDLLAMSKMAAIIHANTMSLHTLNCSSPLITKMKAEFDRLKSASKAVDSVKNDYSEYKSALTIPLDSIAGRPIDRVEDPDAPVFE